MSLVERHYRLLLVSSGDKFIREAGALLQSDQYQTEKSSSASDARCKLLENAYDIVIVNAPLSDESGSRLCIDASQNNGTIAALLSANDSYAEVYAKASVHGERLRTAEKKADKAQSRLDSIRIVNKAKWLLIENEGMSEAEAHKHVERAAMDAGITKKLAAQLIIDNYLK